MKRLYHIKEGTQLKASIERVVPQLLKVAQKVYDTWNQDETGHSESYGYGGICDDIADVFCYIMIKANIDCFSQYSPSYEHTSAYATDFIDYDFIGRELVKEIMYQVDISPYRYEEGAGYNWTKIPNVVFDESDITIEDMSWVVSDWFNEEGELIEY